MCCEEKSSRAKRQRVTAGKGVSDKEVCVVRSRRATSPCQALYLVVLSG